LAASFQRARAKGVILARMAPISLVRECLAFRPSTTSPAARQQRVGAESGGMDFSCRLFPM
jgi:hypothetical protein